jgi:hypothetical protein
VGAHRARLSALVDDGLVAGILATFISAARPEVKGRGPIPCGCRPLASCFAARPK